ncbi:hypothetical protein C7999DRAFT_35156 [Corynascus novoguineensis]|uniref:MARVEL domain-containing protein n=1 Tax=Corynascus novoguineensis TaxID=1126955 RepID=A0AAN7HJR7_9PEZI|nr:hypothetical protein C7999DRAFT_35156 [Corynascus novoguineensis]
MADGGNSAAEPRVVQSDQGTEGRGVENATDERQRERQEDETQPSPPPPPPKPLPPSHKELKHQPLPPSHKELKHQPPFSQSHGAPFGPVSVGQLPVGQLHDEIEQPRPEHPVWRKTKSGLLMLSLMVCAVIFGICIALGFEYASDSDTYYGAEGLDFEFGLSGTAAGLAIVVTAVEFLKTLFSSRREGMHPGALVAFHLLIWLVALVAGIMTALFNAFADWSRNQTALFERVLVAFDCILFLIHFILFVGACVETNQLKKANRGVVVVRVPVPVGPGYPGAPYPVYGSAGQFVPLQPGTQPGHSTVPMMTQISPQAGNGAGPVPPQPAALYAGYYAPASQGYYAPAPVVSTAAHPSRSSRGPPASRSESRRSQRQVQDGQQSEPTSQSTQSQLHNRQEEPTPGRTA